MNGEEFQEANFSDLLNLIRKGLLLSLITAALAAVATYFLSQQIAPRYQATATVIAAQTAAEASRFGISLATATPLDVATYRAAAMSYPVISNAMRQLGQEPITTELLSEFRRNVTVRAEDSRTSSLLYISAVADSPQESARKANAIANALVSWDKDRATENLQLIINTLRSQINALNEEIRIEQVANTSTTQDLEGKLTLRAQQSQQLTYAETLLTSATGLLKTLEPALPPIQPISPRPVRNAALAFVLGIFLSYGLLLLRDALSIRFKSSEEIASLTRLPILAEFPKLPGGSRRLPQEAVNYLRTNLLFTLSKMPQKTLLVTSALSAEGKSSVALSLAESFARNGYNTLLVDADLRKPIIAKEYGLDAGSYGAISLEKVLQSSDPPAPLTVSVDSKFSFCLYPTFHATSSATELLSRNFHHKLNDWRKEFEVIIIDSAPLLPVADTLTIAPLCTGAILVTGFEGADKKSVRKATELLSRLGINILGVAATQRSRESRRNQSYGYGYGYGESAPAQATRTTRA